MIVRVWKRYADVTYTGTRYAFQSIDNVSDKISSQYLPRETILKMWDSLLPGNTSETPPSPTQASSQIFTWLVGYLGKQEDLMLAGLASIPWRILLYTDINYLTPTIIDENSVTVTSCTAVDRIQLPFHTFMIFTSFCFFIWGTCLCFLLLLAQSAIPETSATFPDLELAMDWISSENSDASNTANQVFARLASVDTWAIMRALNKVRIEIREGQARARINQHGSESREHPEGIEMGRLNGTPEAGQD